MFELPEFVTLAKQINQTIRGKTIQKGSLGNSPHKFVWYNRTHEEFEQLTKGKIVDKTTARGKWLFVTLEPGYVLLFGECGGKMLYHAPGDERPSKYHLAIEFVDESTLTVLTQMWGAMELHEQGQELERQYINVMAPTPTDPEFTWERFSVLIDETIASGKRSVKGLLTQDQLIPGIGNAIAQDIMFRAHLHPRFPIDELEKGQKQDLYYSIKTTIQNAIDMGGRDDERDLFNKPGGYVRLMDNKTAGNPCPECGSIIEKMQYLGGTCYFCPKCQKLPARSMD